MTKTILVTGGTGTLGRRVVRRLADSGHQVRVLSRRTSAEAGWFTGDLATGVGLAEAVRDGDMCTVRGTREAATLRRLVTWSLPPSGPTCRIWCTSRSSGWTGCRSATSGRSSRWSG